MGINSPDQRELDAWTGDQIVDNPDERFAADRKVVFKKIIVIVMNGSVQGVLNWDHCSVTFSVYDREENLFKSLEWYQNGIIARQLICGDLAERPRLSLKCDSALQTHSHFRL